jgi:hypothetical protein
MFRDAVIFSVITENVGRFFKCVWFLFSSFLYGSLCINFHQYTEESVNNLYNFNVMLHEICIRYRCKNKAILKFNSRSFT